MLFALARRSLLPAQRLALQFAAAAGSGTARHVQSLPQVARGLQIARETETQPLEASASVPQETQEPFGFRVRFDEVPSKNSKLRLDAYLTSKLPEVSRSQLQHGIKSGLVRVNGVVHIQSGKIVRPGDIVACTLPPPPVTTATPQDIPLDIVFEDEYLMVINKAAGMVVHPAPGNLTGTLVNAVLHHCNLPEYELPPGQRPPQTLCDWPDPDAPTGDEILSEDDTLEVAPEVLPLLESQQPPPPQFEQLLLRPGVVHRLDKGTTGLIVMAKDAKTQWHLADQFREHTVERTYNAIVLRVPAGPKGIVETRIGRNAKDRKKMAALPTHASRGRWARSSFQLLEALPDATAALTQWNLSTGRTHQIRVHAQHVGHPLLGDEAYGGAGGAALFMLAGENPARRVAAKAVIRDLGRPALHAKSLGFVHPATGQRMQFESELPHDFVAALESLRELCEMGGLRGPRSGGGQRKKQR